MESVILGIGNLLLGDEGVGVHAARALAEETLPDKVEVLEIGTSILAALPALEKARRIIVIDAMKAQGRPGTIYRVLLENCQRNEHISSMHDFDLPRLFALAGRSDLPECVVFGIEPAAIDWTLDLSPQVRACIPFLVDAVKGEVRCSRG
jgi:hydrogenase maturation protease